MKQIVCLLVCLCMCISSHLNEKPGYIYQPLSLDEFEVKKDLALGVSVKRHLYYPFTESSKQFYAIKPKTSGTLTIKLKGREEPFEGLYITLLNDRQEILQGPAYMNLNTVLEWEMEIIHPEKYYIYMQFSDNSMEIQSVLIYFEYDGEEAIFPLGNLDGIDYNVVGSEFYFMKEGKKKDGIQ